MVGDSPVNDVTGARNAGWHGIWLNRDGATCPQQDAQISTLLELPRVLARIQATTPPVRPSHHRKRIGATGGRHNPSW